MTRTLTPSARNSTTFAVNAEGVLLDLLPGDTISRTATTLRPETCRTAIRRDLYWCLRLGAVRLSNTFGGAVATLSPPSIAPWYSVDPFPEGLGPVGRER